ncbi:MAG: hypothetical protein IV105_03000 [Rhizobacter sp.]|nr:hypothetical protein [Rhizobacter sp.]
MKTKLRLIACAVALTSLASVAHAQAQDKRNAVSLFGNISSSSDFSQANVSASYERLVTDKLSVLGSVTYFKVDAGGSDTTSTTVSGGATYYVGQPLQASNMLFYGKGVVSFSHLSGGGGSGTGFGAFAGLEQPLGESTSLFEELGYQRAKYDDVSFNQVVFNIGLKLRF